MHRKKDHLENCQYHMPYYEKGMGDARYDCQQDGGPCNLSDSAFDGVYAFRNGIGDQAYHGQCKSKRVAKRQNLEPTRYTKPQKYDEFEQMFYEKSLLPSANKAAQSSCCHSNSKPSPPPPDLQLAYENKNFRRSVIDPVKNMLISQDSLSLPEEKMAANKPQSARSNQTARSKKAEDLVQLQKSRCALLDVIDESIDKIANLSLTSVRKAESKESTSQAALATHDTFTNMIKDLRSNHYKNITHECRNLEFLDSLSEKVRNSKE